MPTPSIAALLRRAHRSSQSRSFAVRALGHGVSSLFAFVVLALATIVMPALTLISATIVHGQEPFRVETDVFVGKETEPIQYLTLFNGRLVYDFRVTKPEEVTVYDWDRNRIVLLDPARKTKATLATDDVLNFTAGIKTHVSESNSVFHAATHPGFSELVDEPDGWRRLGNKHITYRFRGTPPKSPDNVARYRDFADWSARLSAMRPGNLPPYARMEANRRIAELGWLPDEVQRTVDPGKLGFRKMEARSRHLFNELLSETDRKRIERASNWAATFQDVGFPEFRDAALVSQSTTQPRK